MSVALPHCWQPWQVTAMVEFGFDTVQDGCVCLAKRWKKQNVTAGFLLTAFGTLPAVDSISQDSMKASLTITAGAIQECLESAATSDGSQDLLYCATRLMDTFAAVHGRIRALRSLLGQGIYIGGAVVYFAGQQYILFPFGGVSCHTWDGIELIRQGSSAFEPGADGLIHDAIGCTESWKGQCWQGTLAPGRHLLCMTGEPDQEAARKSLRQATGRHPNTLAMLLRREQQKVCTLPAGVLDLWNREG